MLKKAYLEITNECNLACSFCHGTRRPIKYMSVKDFTEAATSLRPYTEYLYFHLMGEPLLHPDLSELFDISARFGFKVILTTNGSMLRERGDILLRAPALHKVSISVHAYEANTWDITLEEYLESCLQFCAAAAKKGIICVLRLWNIGGEESMNEKILEFIRQRFGDDWKNTYSGARISDRLFLEWGEKFDWPDMDAEYCSDSHSCYGLRDQIGILSDGRVVPCCLDSDGVITLGNIFEQPLEEILNSQRAVALKRSFENRCITEPLCQRCGFAHKRVK